MKLNTTTHFCKICFKPIEKTSLTSLFYPNKEICQNCFYESCPKFIKFKEQGIDCLSLYNYDDYIRKWLYQFKGLNDYELKNTFLGYILPVIKIKYRGYKIIPVPSSKSHNELRGYNQVIEMFKILGFEILDYLVKTKESKQSSLSYKERFKSENLFDYGASAKKLTKFKVLIVDDVYTSGTSIRACIKLVRRLNPKRIKVLVLAKTLPPKEDNPNKNKLKK